jgi:hypothetical protein
MKIDSLAVTVPERPYLGHVNGGIGFLPSLLTIQRLEKENQVSDRGAHIILHLPSVLVLGCFSRKRSVFNFKGPDLGQLTEAYGLASFEGCGFLEHAVTEIRMCAETDIPRGIFHLELSGGLALRRQSQDHWKMPKPLSAFKVDVTVPIMQAGSIFHGNDAQKQARVEEQLERFDSD